MTDVPAVKDEDHEHPVASAWRSTFQSIVGRFVAGDYALDGLAHVEETDEATRKQIAGYIEDYGETLTALPEETWDSSVAQWMDGHWDVLVDLWTEGEGRSDLVLGARVTEDGGVHRVRVELVYVP